MKQQKKVKKIIQKFELECFFQADAVNISLLCLQSYEKIYYACYSNDNIPEILKLLFSSAEQLYEYIAEDTCEERIQIKNPNELIILYKVGRNTKSTPLILCQKILSNQDRLRLRVRQLQTEIEQYKQRSVPEFQALLQKLDSQRKDKQICYLTMQLQQFHKKNAKLQQKSKAENQLLINKNKQYEMELQNLRKQNQYLKHKNEGLMIQKQFFVQKSLSFEMQNQQLKIKLNKIYNKLKTKAFVLHQLKFSEPSLFLDQQQVVISSAETILQIDSKKQIKKQQERYLKKIRQFKQKSQVFSLEYSGQILVFRPLTSSINYNFYEFRNNILTKSDPNGKTVGRMIPCASSIPPSGNYCYKVVAKQYADKPHFRIGVTAKNRLISQSYINAKDTDSVIFYCQKNQQNTINQGSIQKQGFVINKNNILLIEINQNQGLVKWYLDQELKQVSYYTESMKKALKLYLFIQLWTNGDSIQMLKS